MSSHAARGAAGPLHSAIGQWAVLGLGAYAVVGGENLSELFRDGLRLALRLCRDQPDADRRRQAYPIVVHSAPATSSSSWRPASVLSLLFGAGLCWGSYVILCSPWFPESVRELFPVSRELLDRAVVSLGRGIAGVRDALTVEIARLSSSQEVLSDRQEATHGEVLAAQSDLSDLRCDLGCVQSSLWRWESRLASAEARVSYVARGVRLLARCVRSVIPANNALASDLDEFSRADPEDAVSRKGDEDWPELGSIVASSIWRSHVQQQQSPSISAARTPRRLERIDSVPERTENERPEAPSRDELDEVRVLLLNPDRLSFQS